MRSLAVSQQPVNYERLNGSMLNVYEEKDKNAGTSF